MWLHFTDEALRHQKISDMVRSLSQQGSAQDRHPCLSDRTAAWGFLGSGRLEQFSTLALKVPANPSQPAFILWSFLHKPFPSETISQLGPALLFLNSRSYTPFPRQKWPPFSSQAFKFSFASKPSSHHHQEAFPCLLHLSTRTIWCGRKPAWVWSSCAVIDCIAYERETCPRYSLVLQGEVLCLFLYLQASLNTESMQVSNYNVARLKLI